VELCNLLTVTGQCENPHNIYLSNVSLRASTILDILTDLLIIAIPITLAWRVKLPIRTRIALVAVFAMGFIIPVVAVVRIVVLDATSSKHPELSWLNLWTLIESTVAVFVCCLAPFKVLFSRGTRPVRHGYNGPYSYSYGSDGRRWHGRRGKDIDADLDTEMSTMLQGTHGEVRTKVTAIPVTRRSVGRFDRRKRDDGQILVSQEVAHESKDSGATQMKPLA